MPSLGVEDHLVDRDVRDRAVAHFRSAGVVLPTFAELADPAADPGGDHVARWPASSPTSRDPLNLFRVHWYNDAIARAVADGARLTSCCRRR